jgi:hypothetical protein
MRFVTGAALLFVFFATAAADTVDHGRLRFAAAAAEACFANCANENASCKRVCPATLSTPCLSACDSQMQTCRQGCQSR